ncbi:MAG: GNAT family N-acetyltransferase [Butyrivibrio sp.]|nr:GNAT family N-acetyltransferase [Butyrivibrio sp.]
MMVGTIVNKKNQNMFLPGVSNVVKKICNTYVGVIDEETGLACGVLGAQMTEFNGLDICYVYVAERFRGFGAGAELIRFFVETARENGFEHISCSHVRNDETMGLYEILENAGFVEILDLRTPVYAMPVTAVITERRPISYSLITLGKVMSTTWANLVNKKLELAKNDLTGSEIELSDRNYYDPRLSIIAVDKAGKCHGALLLSAYGRDYKVECLYSSGKDAGAILLSLISAAKEEVARNSLTNIWIYVNISSEKTKKIIKRLLSKKPLRSGECIFQVKSL